MNETICVVRPCCQVQPHTASVAPEVWAGAEYTCNRVGDRYLDQMNLSGHAERLADLEQFRSLGIKTLRFGLLWERHELNPSWQWADERLDWMRASGIRPIAGLMHHGSGPAHTSLLDPGFPSTNRTRQRDSAGCTASGTRITGPGKAIFGRCCCR